MNKNLVIALVISGLAITGCNEKSSAEQVEKQAASAPSASNTVASPAAAEATLETEEQQVSYGIGLNVGQNVANQGFELDLPAFTAGLTDAVKGNEPQMSQEDIMKVMQDFQQKMMAKRKEERETQAVEQKQAAEGFFNENGKKEGVVTTDSGMQYKVITAGTGKIPSADDTVEVNYRGTLLDGTEFDSSYKRGQPVTFPVKGVIKGWTEALQLMPIGSKWELYIPSNLAYGPGGTGPIPPNAALKFEVELLNIVERKTAAPKAEG